MAPGRYLAVFLATILVLCIVDVAVTVAVDPYYVFGTRVIAGWNLQKPAAHDREILAKTHLLGRTRPRTLLLGNSRVNVGLDPDSAVWPAGLRPVFNAGVDGSGPEVAVAMLADDTADPALHNVVLGLDFTDFLVPALSPDPGGDLVDAASGPVPAHLQPDLQHWRAWLADALGATLTIDALTDSVMTVLQQGGAGQMTMTPDGFNPLNDYKAYVRVHGFRALFEQKQAAYDARFIGPAAVGFDRPYLIPGFRSLRSIVRMCQGRGLNLTIIIYPYHAWLLDRFRQVGLLPAFEAWKQAVIRVVTGLDPDGRVRVVDFSGYNQVSTERVPPAGDRVSTMRWYWEPGHFRRALGDRMIGVLFGGPPDRFGRVLWPPPPPQGTADAIR